MSVKILLKSTNEVGKIPNKEDLDIRELAININDSKLFSKDVNGKIMGLKLLSEPTTLDRNNNNGSMELSNGYIIKWGYIDNYRAITSSVIFATAFPNECFNATFTDYKLNDKRGSKIVSILRKPPTNTGLEISTDINTDRIYWNALGY